MSDDISFFNFDKLLSFNSPVYLVKISCGVVVAATKNVLIRFSINDFNNTLEEIKITSEDDLVLSLFIDPFANHIIISMKSCQSFYLSRNSKKVRLLKEAKGLLLNAVGWNIRHSNESSTQNILIGTNDGEIIETKLSNNTPSVEQYWNKIYVFDQAVNSIIFDSYAESNFTKFFLIITTSNNIYPINADVPNVTIGTPIFGAAFEKINQMSEGIRCTTFPFDFGYSQLDQFYSHKKKFPKYISWMTGAGIYWATINKKVSEVDGNLFVKPKLLYYSQTNNEFRPINIANTKFHIIMQSSDVIDIYCTINDAIVSTFNYDLWSKEKYVGLCKDHSNGYIYVYTDRHFFRINCDQETKELWRTFVKCSKFDLAYKYSNNEEQKSHIRLVQAEEFYEQKKYEEAGKLLVSTFMSFEEATLKFVDLENKEGLKSYLLQYASINSAKSSASQNTYDVVCIWLLEIFFEQINVDQFKTDNEISSETYKASNKDYKSFVENPEIIKSLKRNQMLIYEKIKNYGDFYQSAIFAEIIQDSLKIIEHHLEKGNIKKALMLLALEKSPKAHYLYGQKISQTHPKEIVNMWIKFPRLDPKKLLPILRTIDEEIAFTYVNHLIEKGYSEKSYATNLPDLHDFYVLLCAKLANRNKTNTSNDQLMKYLKHGGHNAYQTNYDPQLALRICLEWEHLEGAVFLYSLLQKYREAVELALQKERVELAREVALKFNGSEEMKKHLWLQIAKFIIEKKQNVADVCALVRSQHSLKLEDILSFFPDSCKLENFSETICDSLTYYYDHNENLQQDRKLANEYASKIRNEIKYLKQRPIIVPCDSKCAYCDELLTLRSFCLFSCKHFFHKDCMVEVTTNIRGCDPYSNFAEFNDKLEGVGLDNQKLKNDWTSEMTKNCCYCGTITIDMIDKPIMDFSKFETEMKKWE